MKRVAVLGAGSWGTTFAKVLADAGCDVALHARRPELADHLAERGVLAAHGADVGHAQRAEVQNQGMSSRGICRHCERSWCRVLC